LINKINFVDPKSAKHHAEELMLLTAQVTALDAMGMNSTFRSDLACLLMNLPEPSTGAIFRAIHEMLRSLPPKHEPANRMQGLAWQLFLNEDDLDDGEPCWSAPIRRELRALKPATRRLWIALLKLAPTAHPPDAKWEEKIKKVLGCLGRQEWEGRIKAWIAGLRKVEPVALERSGQVLLRLVMELSGAVESAALVSSLASVVDVQWGSPRSEAFWLEIAPRLALRLYPHVELHDAIRTLAARPIFANAPEIQRVVNEIGAAVEMPDASTGIDDFPLQEDQQLANFQLRIDRLLRQPASSTDDNVRYLLPQRSADHDEKLLRAIQKRIDWLATRRPALDKFKLTTEWARYTNWNSLLQSVRSKLLDTGAGIERGDLLRLLREGNHAAFDRAAEYTAQHGYKADIVEAVRQYQGTLHGSVSDQARRQHVGWWLWLEDVTPINPRECWSSIVRTDLRSFTGPRKTAWLSMIRNMTFAVSAKPPAKWTKTAKAALSAIDPEDFRNQLLRWLAPMAPSENTKQLCIGTPGRDFLRCLIWDCLFAPLDPLVDEALTWIDKATWKNKQSRDRMLKIYGPLREVLSARDPELARQLEKSEILLPESKPTRPAPSLDAVWNTAMIQVLKSMPVGEHIEMHPDHIRVRGQRDEYRITMDGVITRRSGRTVRVNMEALPDYITEVVQPAIDALDLAQGMFQPNRMRLLSLATILVHDAQWESAIE
jgi:hypothetical protein